MIPYVRAYWPGNGPQQRTRRVFVPRSLLGSVRPGSVLIGSEQHNIGVWIRPAVRLTDVPVDPIPKLQHNVVLTPELQRKLEVLVIHPTLNAGESEVMVVFVGPTGAGKTTAKQYCVAQVAEQCERRVAYFDLPAGYFRRSYWGESELVTRELFTRALEFGEAGYRVFISFEDAEATLQSRGFSQRNTSGCGSTAAATTSEFLHGLGKLADANIGCTVLTSSNYDPYGFDPALTAAHRLRGVIRFGTLPMTLLPSVVETHARRWKLPDDVTHWVTASLSAPVVLARGRQGNAACEVTLEDCLTPSVIAGVVKRTNTFACGEMPTREHAAEAFAEELLTLAHRIAAHAQDGEIGMLVPRLAEAKGLQLTPAFDPNAVTAQAKLESLVVPA